MKYYREYIGEGQEEITRPEAMETLAQFYRDVPTLMDDLDSGRCSSIRLPGGYIAAEKE